MGCSWRKHRFFQQSYVYKKYNETQLKKAGLKTKKTCQWCPANVVKCKPNHSCSVIHGLNACDSSYMYRSVSYKQSLPHTDVSTDQAGR
jgi:hypothetical protein